MPWLIQPLLGIGTLALVGALGHHLYDTRVATVAVLLGALSPFHNFLVGSYLSHTGTAFFATLAYYLLVRSGWGAHRVLTLCAGAALGMTFLCRELTALEVGLPLAVSLSLHLPKGQAKRKQEYSLIYWAAGLGLLLALYGLYNWSITGAPRMSPRVLLDPTDVYGFGTSGIGYWGEHTLAAGLVNLDQLLTALMIDMGGWPYYTTLAVPLIPFVLARFNRWDVLNGTIVLIMVVALVGYYKNGILIGPRYCYEAVPALLLLTARGVQVLGEVVGDLLLHARRWQAAGPFAAYAILIALILPNLFFYLPRQLALYHNFPVTSSTPYINVSRVAAQVPRNAIIITPNRYIFDNLLAGLNDPATLANPTASRGTVWAFASTTKRFAQLFVAYPHRHVYLFEPKGMSIRYLPWSPDAVSENVQHRGGM